MKPKLLLTWATLLGVTFTTQLRAEVLDPLDFTSLGTFNVTNGGYIINTDAVTITETNASSSNVLFTGVIDDQGGQADSFGPGGSVTNVGPLGIPHIAVFTFGDLVLDGTAAGHRALALLSHGNVVAPLLNWLPVTSNLFDASGNSTSPTPSTRPPAGVLPAEATMTADSTS